MLTNHSKETGKESNNSDIDDDMVYDIAKLEIAPLVSIERSAYDQLYDYIRTEVLKSRRFSQFPKPFSPLSKFVIRFVLAILGTTWGIPWWSIAVEGIESIIPDGFFQNILTIIFATGEIVTVGADGLWIMLELGDDWLRIKSKEEMVLIGNKEKKYKRLLENGCILTVSSVLAITSCISPVYAIVKYSQGAKKYTAIFTLIGNFGKGIYGYSKLIKQFIIKPANQFAHYKDYEKRSLYEHKKELLEAIDYELSLRTLDQLDEFSTTDEILIHFENNLKQLRQQSRWLKYIGSVIAYPSASLVAVSSTTVGFYLIKEAFEKGIYDNVWVSTPIAILADIPSAVVNFISTKAVLEKIVNIVISVLFKKKMDYNKQDIFKQVSCLFLCLTSPAAAAYITYKTLNDKSVPKMLTCLATISIGSARILFSNFTLNYIASRLILRLGDVMRKESRSKHLRLTDFRRILPNTQLRFFQSTNSSTKEESVIELTTIIQPPTYKGQKKSDCETVHEQIIMDNSITSTKKLGI